MATNWTADSNTITADSSVSVDNPPAGYSVAEYPNVPAMPGVPVLARQQTAAQVAAAASGAGLNAAIAAQLGLPGSVVFGSSPLYAGLGLHPLDPAYAFLDSNGNAVLSPDSCVELDVSADSTLNSHPIELGQFELYNRVQQPVQVRLLLGCQGIGMAYTSFLATLKAYRETPQLVTLSLPNDSYDNMALQKYSYSRKAERGAVTIYADTFWREERSTNVVVSAPPTTAPQGATVNFLGAMSPAAPSALQQASISNPPVPPVDLPVTGFIPDITTIGNGGMPPSGDAY